MGIFGSLLLYFMKIVVYIWDFHTSWIYSIMEKPDLVKKNRTQNRAKLTKPIKHSDTSATFLPCYWQKTTFIDEFEEGKFTTLADVWDWSLQRYGDKKLLGTRTAFEETTNTQTKYKWITYNETDNSLTHLGIGLRTLGQQANQNICICAETRPEWMISAQACFRNSFPVVTISPTLGLDGILHCLWETEVEMVIISYELLPTFRTLLTSNKVHVKTIVYMENPTLEANNTGFGKDVKIISFSDAISLGTESLDVCFPPIKPQPKTPAIIMYTSGSTGVPKGVVLTHRNIVTTISSFQYFNNPHPNDLYIAYLPLSHVFEFLFENIMVAWGVPIGYSHPSTLLDSSTLGEKGSSGDITILRPTIMICVPLVLDRINKQITEQIRMKNTFAQHLFDFCISYKSKCHSLGEITPIIDRIFLREFANKLGGRVRTIVTGGAPLSPETHNFLRTVLGVTLQQVYALTETGACGTIMDRHDNSVGRAGGPLQGIHIKLVNWEDGSYLVTDKPFPRGEIFIGGDNVAHGYFKLDEKNNEDFFTDDDGRRWFKTGDIGQVEYDGSLRIIDRKKDLIKIQNGEYVSLGKVESILKGCSSVSNICVFGNSKKNYVVALIFPKLEALNKMAFKSSMGFEILCKSGDIVELVHKEVVQHGIQAGLQRYEIPAVITLTSLEWTASNGLTTAAMKLRRLAIKKYYQETLDKMFAD